MQIRNLTFFFALISITALWVTEKLSETPELDSKVLIQVLGKIAIAIGVSFGMAWFFTKVLKVKIGERTKA